MLDEVSKLGKNIKQKTAPKPTICENTQTIKYNR